MSWELSAKWRVEELLRGAEQAQLAHQAPPQPPSGLASWMRNMLYQLTAARVMIHDRSADEPLWPRLNEYPYAWRRRG